MTRISVNSNGEQANKISQYSQSLSSDGRYVAFSSEATNLVESDNNDLADVFVRDRLTANTVRASVSSEEVEANGLSSDPVISADGRYVAYSSYASNLVPGDSNFRSDIFLRDLVSATTERVSVSSAGVQATDWSNGPSISPDGRFVAFRSDATNLVSGDTTINADIFVRDRLARTTKRVSVSSSGAQANYDSWNPSVSSNGQRIAFESHATNLVPLDTNSQTDIFVRDLTAGTTTRVSVTSLELEGSDRSDSPSISGDGRYVAFSSHSELVQPDTNGFADIFVRDLSGGTTARISTGIATGGQTNGDSGDPALSANGRFVAFHSAASNLVSSDTNAMDDVFLHTLSPGGTVRVSLAPGGIQSNGWSHVPSISSDGRFVAFRSDATNLVANDSNGVWDIFLRDGGEKTPPVVTPLTSNPNSFSPNNDGLKDATTLSASISDDSPPITWTISIRNSVGVQMRTFSGASTAVSQVWDGKNSIGVRVPDGVYTATLTATDDWGNMSSRSTNVTVDTLPPLIAPGGITPVNRFADVLRLTNLSATWQDALSGVDGATLRMWLDGSALPVTVSGSTVTSTPAGVTAGIHLVDLEGRDLAGNLATDSFPFTLVSVTGSPGTASLVAQTVKVNPTNKIPPPSTVRFTGPKVDVSKTTETLNASSRVGHGTSSRYVSLGSVDVVFRNGSLTKTVSANVPTTTESHKVATAAPSAGPLKAVIDAHRVSIPDIVVDVPVGFNTAQSEATLTAKTVSLGSPVVSDGPFLGSDWEDTVPILGTIGACFTGNGDGVVSECQIDTSSKVYAKVGPAGEVRQIYVPTTPISDPSLDGTVSQTCSGCVQPESIREGEASLVLRCPTTVVQGRSINLCSGVPDAPATSGPWAGYLNAWLYKEGTPKRFPLWQQNHAQGAASSCPNGADGQVTGRTYRLVANATALDGSSGALIGGTWDDPFNPSLLEEYVYLGTMTGNSRPGQLSEDPSIPFQLSNEAAQGGATVPLQILGQGTYLAANPQALMDPAGVLTTTPSGTTNGWQYGSDPTSNGPGTTDRLQIMTGTEFRTPAAPNTYNVLASLGLQFVLDFSQCA